MPPTDVTVAPGPLVTVPVDARGRFGPAPFQVANSLPDHPLFEPDRIRRLLRTLPKDAIEIREVGVAVGDAAAGGYARGRRLTDVDPVEAFDGLDAKPTWILLHRAWEHDDDFGDLLREYVRGLKDSFEDMRGRISDMGCWIFLSSGSSVVHFHADPDQSFLNQVRGSKTVYVYPARILPTETVEKLVYFSDQGVVRYDPAYERERCEPVHLVPGDTVFLPLYAPHRVVNDDGICVSMNVGFQTVSSRRRGNLHSVNFELRSMGGTPTPVGERPLLDAVKSRSRIAFRVKNKILPGLRPRLVL